MKVIKETNKDFGYIRILDLYSKKELKDIWKEISYLDYVMDTVEFPTDRAIEDGKSKMTGSGLFLDSIYINRSYSAILTYNRKLFIGDIYKKMCAAHPANKIPYHNINKDATMLNRYSDSQEYLPHFDIATFTAITVLLHKPEKLKGGEFYFKDYDVSFGCINNSCVIFPSWVEHSVRRIECREDSKRYSIAQLMYINFFK